MVLSSAGMSVALAMAIGTSGVRKFWADAASERLRSRLRLGSGLWRATGVLELCVAVGLLVGLSSRPLGVAAAVVVIIVMVGAVALHVRVGFTGAALVAPIVVLGAGTLTAALRLAVA